MPQGVPSAPVLAVDIGGTKIITAIIAAGGEMVAKDRCPTLASEGVAAVTARLMAAIDGLLARQGMAASQLGGIALASAGAIDTGRGVVTTSPNLPGWRDVPLSRVVGERYGVAAYLLNDASAAALGEHRFGAGRGTRHLVLLTLGTGIGGGIVIGGEMYAGACGSAAEIGHMVIADGGPACPCGRRGCLEALASGTAVAREAGERLRRDEETVLAELVGGDAENLTAEMVAEAARNGDTLAGEVFSRAGYYLGVGLANLVNIFNPEMIVLGGGMAVLEDIFVEPARRVAAATAFPISAGAVRIVTASLGEEAGVYGAAAYALDMAVRRPR